MDTTRNGQHVVNYGTYVSVWLTLMVLMALTIAAAGLGLGAISVLTVLAIAGAKSALVLYFFMHLRYEGYLIRFIFFATVMVLVVIIALTYLEVILR